MAKASSEVSGTRPCRRVQLALHVGAPNAPAHRISGVTTLGSAADSDIVVPDASVAAHQLRLVPTGEGVALTNLAPHFELQLRAPSGEWGPRIVGDAVISGPGRFKLGETVLFFEWAMPEPRVHPGVHGFVGHSPIIEALRRTIDACAAHDRPLLLRGPCTDLVKQAARAIHAASRRREGPERVSSGALIGGPNDLPMLVGWTEAAFKGVAPYEGLILGAHRGTLTLIDLDCLPPDRVPHLMQLLREHTVTRLGANAPEPVDARLILANNELLGVPLHPEVEALARECEAVRIPRVSEFPEDLPELLAYFTEREPGHGAGVEWSEEAIAVVRGMGLKTLRSLQDVVERSLTILAHEDHAASSKLEMC